VTIDEMKRFVRNHFEDFVNRREIEAADRNFAPEFIDHDGPEHKLVGVKDDKQMMLSMYETFSDLRVDIEDIIAESDRVVCRNVWRGTDTATGNKMIFTGIVIWRFQNDKIVERWASIQPAQRLHPLKSNPELRGPSQ